MKRFLKGKRAAALLLILTLVSLLCGCSYTREGSVGGVSFSVNADAGVNVDQSTASATSAPEAAAKPTAKATKTPEIQAEPTDAQPTEAPEIAVIDRDGTYTSKDDVALYLYTYGELPSNFITKKEARALGWENGSLEPYAPGKCIGGDYFGNYEGLLPEKKGREYHECDIDTLGKSKRGAKRIIYSNDRLIYYTDDHYESFVLLYGEE